MLINNLDEIPEIFKDGIRGILLLHRNKEGEIGNAQRKSIKKISRGPIEWNEIVREFKYLQKNLHTTHRIYTSVNSRNMSKAIHEYKRRQLESDYYQDPLKDWFYIDSHNNFFSCLMDPKSKNQSNFLIDCDNEEDYDKAKERIPSDLFLFEYRTKNGKHIICKPFNPNEIKVEYKKDDLMFIG